MRMIYYFFGSDSYRIGEAIRELVAGFGGGFEVSKVDGSKDKFHINDISKKIGSNDLFGSKQLVIVEGLSGKNTKLKDKEQVLKYIKDLKCDESELVFKDGQVDKRSVIYKALKSKADKVQEQEEMDSAQMESWIRDRSKKIGLKISQENRKKLSAMIGGDSWQAFHELEKLKNYTKGRELEYGDIDLLVRARLDDDIFLTVDMIAKGDKKRALELLRNQFSIGNEPLYLLAMIARQFRILIQIKGYSDGGGSGDNYAMAKKLGLHPFVVQKSMVMVNKFSSDDLRDIYKKIIDTDQKLKSSKVDGKIILERLVVWI